jgi:hypothetical protein
MGRIYCLFSYVFHTAIGTREFANIVRSIFVSISYILMFRDVTSRVIGFKSYFISEYFNVFSNKYDLFFNIGEYGSHFSLFYFFIIFFLFISFPILFWVTVSDRFLWKWLLPFSSRIAPLHFSLSVVLNEYVSILLVKMPYPEHDTNNWTSFRLYYILTPRWNPSWLQERNFITII